MFEWAELNARQESCKALRTRGRADQVRAVNREAGLELRPAPILATHHTRDSIHPYKQPMHYCLVNDSLHRGSNHRTD